MSHDHTSWYNKSTDRRPEIRDAIQSLKETALTRSQSLGSEQHALLAMILDRGSSFEQVARLRGEHAGTVSRRFRRLVRQLSGRLPQKPSTKGQTASGMDRSILGAYYLYGMTQSQIATRLGVSRYRVRKALAGFSRTIQERQNTGITHEEDPSDV